MKRKISYRNIKSWFKYLGYILLILFLMFLKIYITNPLVEEAKNSFKITPYQYLIPFLFNIGIGIVLGLDNLLNEFKKSGSWKINIPKLIFLGIPSFYFSFALLLSFINNEFVQKVLLSPVFRIMSYGGTSLITIFQVIFGFTIITSFHKGSNRSISMR